MKSMKTVLILTKNPNLPSFRYRLAPLVDLLSKKGHCVTVQLFRSKFYGFRVFKLRHAIRNADVVYVHKLKLYQFETRLLRSMTRTLFFDVDDAFYVKQPKTERDVSKACPSRLAKFNLLAKMADISSVGNSILADVVHKAGGRPLLIPTGIDVENYTPISTEHKQGLSLIWVGLPANLRYLDLVKDAFIFALKKHPSLKLLVMSSKPLDWGDLPVENIPWSSEAEKIALPRADIGIMPLFDDEYSRGKCAFKLLQYMAAGLPCIASPVGANCDVIRDGENGFLASSEEDWKRSLDCLLSSRKLRQEMGDRGREFVVSDYDTKVIAQELASAVLGDE
jgi:glycosyltransferase involved in cell wall biosynthesis